MIPMQRQTTVRAIMPAFRKCFAHFLSAAAALLACTTGIDFHEPHASLFSFAAQYAHEAAPGSVRDCPAESVAPQHPQDVEALHCNQAVGKDQTTGDLMMMLTAQVAHAGMNPLQAAHRLAAIAAAFLLAGDGTAGAAQLGQGFLEAARIGFPFAVGRSEERFLPHVDTHGRLAGINNRHVGQLAGKHDVPLAGFALQGDGLDRTLNRAVQLTRRSFVNQADCSVYFTERCSVS
jgi:hypothetical protein